jgi:hypothetical protein
LAFHDLAKQVGTIGFASLLIGWIALISLLIGWIALIAIASDLSIEAKFRFAIQPTSSLSGLFPALLSHVNRIFAFRRKAGRLHVHGVYDGARFISHWPSARQMMLPSLGHIHKGLPTVPTECVPRCIG